jgi:hypothetical protein
MLLLLFNLLLGVLMCAKRPRSRRTQVLALVWWNTAHSAVSLVLNPGKQDLFFVIGAESGNDRIAMADKAVGTSEE